MRKKKAFFITISGLCGIVVILSVFLIIENRMAPVNLDIGQYDKLRSQPLKRTIQYPRIGTPIIQKSGEDIYILVNVDNYMTKKIDDFKVLAIHPRKDGLETIQLKTKNVDKTEEGYRIVANIHKKVPADLYDLAVVMKADKDQFLDMTPNSLKVVSEFKDEFSFAQITDIHINTKTSNGGDESNPNNYLLDNILTAINDSNVEFLINTGDICESSADTYKDDYPELANIFSNKLSIPQFITMGNHDGFVVGGENGYEYWDKYIGLPYYSFDYGSWHFVGINSYEEPDNDVDGGIGEKQLEWIENDLKNAREMGKNIIMFAHHTPYDSDFIFWNQSRFDLMKLLDKYTVQAFFSGHRHTDQLDESSTTKFISTRTAQSATTEKVGYRIITIKGDFIESYSADGAKASNRVKLNK